MEEKYLKDYNGKTWQRDQIPAETGIHTIIQPVWGRILDDEGHLIYEGHLIDNMAFGSGTSYYPDGRICQEGLFGSKGLICGRDYYGNGQVRFEGTFQYNSGYGPNWPIFGAWYDHDGVLKYYGPFKVIGRGGSVHMPQVLEPEGFGAVPGLGVLKDHIFGGEKASKYYREYKEIKTAKEKEKHMRLEGPDFLLEYRTNTDRYLPLPDKQYQHFDEWEEEIIRNLCWGAGLLEENRPYFAEFWKVFGVTSLTVTVSSKDTEPAKIVQMIQKADLIECINPDKAEIHFKKFTDDHGNEFIGVNSVIGKEDDDNAEQYLFWKGKTHRFEELNAMNEKEGK